MSRKVPPRRIEYTDYADYLKSDKWKQVKSDYAKESNMPLDICFFCISNKKLQHHHWRYDSNWNNDTWENLILVCDKCHQSIHDNTPISSSAYFTPDKKMEYISSVFKILSKQPNKNDFYDSLWSDSGGSFSITQHGIDPIKSMEMTINTIDQDFISYIEENIKLYRADKNGAK